MYNAKHIANQLVYLQFPVQVGKRLELLYLKDGGRTLLKLVCFMKVPDNRTLRKIFISYQKFKNETTGWFITSDVFIDRSAIRTCRTVG